MDGHGHAQKRNICRTICVRTTQYSYIPNAILSHGQVPANKTSDYFVRGYGRCTEILCSQT